MSEESELKEIRTDISVEWRIKKILSLPKQVGYRMNSATFSLSGAKWHLLLFPYGNTDVDIGWMSLYLLREYSSTSQTSVSFTIGIQKCNGSVHTSMEINHEFKDNVGTGKRRFLKMSKLQDSNDILDLEGTMTIFCTARVSTPRLLNTSVVETACQTSSLEDEELSKSSMKILQENLKDLFLSGRNGDVTFKVQSQEFQTHRSILVARSPVFSAMFDHDTKEKETGIVNIIDCSPDPFKDFLSFLYNGKLDVVSSINAFELYKIADKYNVKDLKDRCAQYMAKELSEANFCDVVLLADMHNEPKLLQTATDFFISNAKTIIQSSEWKTLVTDHYALTNELHMKALNRK